MRVVAFVVVALLVLGACATAESPAATVRPTPSAASPSASATASASAPVPVTGSDPAGKPQRPGVRPEAVEIPAIGVRSTLMSLRLGADGVLERPKEYARAGWYAGGPVPGTTGPAVIAGHVDSDDGPAVFWRLRDLEVGDVVKVALTDGATVAFRVVEVKRYPKKAFPTAQVYGPTPTPTLRLITCGGVWEREGGYRDNVVVFAELA